MTKQTKKQMEEQPRTMNKKEYKEMILTIGYGLSLILKEARKYLTVRELATIFMTVLDTSECDEFAASLLNFSRYLKKKK